MILLRSEGIKQLGCPRMRLYICESVRPLFTFISSEWMEVFLVKLIIIIYNQVYMALLTSRMAGSQQWS